MTWKECILLKLRILLHPDLSYGKNYVSMMLTSVLEHGRQSFFYKLYGLARSEIQQADI